MNLTPRLRAAFLVAATMLGAASAHAATPTRVGDLDAPTRPAGVPADYVVTPNGFFHASCVVELAEGDRVAATGDVVHADGSVRKAAACAFPRFGRDGQVIDAGTDAAPPTINGWVVDSNSNSGATPPSAKSVADFVVPSGPSSAGSQVLYFFPGLESAPNVQSILQPVLAWNGFGDGAWTVTNWNCCISGTTYHGSTIPTATGHTIHGVMKGSSCSTSSGVCTNWKIVSTDKQTSQSTTFNTQAHGQAMNWYFGGVMEVYGVSTCSQYPSNGSITFSNIHFYDLSLHDSTPSNWNKDIGNVSPSCSYGLTATTNKTVITFNP
ncbi:MAG TPA: hypothetical protein VIP05_33390 [Burkholderiaceae bacterium]